MNKISGDHPHPTHQDGADPNAFTERFAKSKHIEKGLKRDPPPPQGIYDRRFDFLCGIFVNL